MSDLSEMEREALEWLKGQGGSVLVTSIPEKNTRGVFGMEPVGNIAKAIRGDDIGTLVSN